MELKEIKSASEKQNLDHNIPSIKLYIQLFICLYMCVYIYISHILEAIDTQII